MKKKKTILKTNKGFSLIEMLIAVTIFAIGLLAMAQLQTHSIVYNAQAQRNTVATIHAQNKMDELRAMDFADLDGENGTTETTGDGYDIEVTVANGPLSDTRNITVEVSWTYKGNKSYEINSIIAEK